ncbi:MULTISPECIES: VPLPA-CTERM sorting domain-containing protein [Methylotenera]|uniref:VPLPA-CTERM sorting domain-containing protein n=1 Tax=Methylotenera TaxID=359407 RepID=UPI000373BEFA|nr:MULTISPECIES: VPLPA-CTERM sorting domain-containing protein [Methylotenera]
MKKILIALGFTFAAMSSQAALTFTEVGTTISTNTYNDVIGVGSGATFAYGFLSADAGDIVTFTNLASFTEAGYTNVFINGVDIFSNKTGDGDTFSFVSAGGALEFLFRDANGVEFTNGNSSIAVVTGSTYGFTDQFLLLLDDSAANLTDFDDHAVGVSAVPVPAALPLMASALGAFGIARRRNKAKAA